MAGHLEGSLRKETPVLGGGNACADDARRVHSISQRQSSPTRERENVYQLSETNEIWGHALMKLRKTPESGSLQKPSDCS